MITLTSFILGSFFGIIVMIIIYKVKNKHYLKIKEIVSPLEEQLQEFKSTIDDAFNEEEAQRKSLKLQIGQLSEFSQKLDDRAKDLSAAFRGDNKIQGNWGERVLENILENSGLRKEWDYKREKVLQDDRGRPDVIVKIPDDGVVIIDSKLSFNSYRDYTNEDNPALRDQYLKELIKSTEEHVKKLGKKSYWATKEYKTPEFVLMFFPIDNLFHVVIDNKKEIYDYAYNHNIILVGPSTLMAALKTISSLWRNIKLASDAEKISDISGKMYDKFKLFIDDILDVQNKLNLAYRKNTSALSKLAFGKGNLTDMAFKIKDLGSKNTKEINISKVEEETTKAHLLLDSSELEEMKEDN